MITAIEKLDIAIVAMSQEEARHCVDEIKTHVGYARTLLLELRDRQGWKALGYENWRECVSAEFPQNQRYLYYQLQAAIIERNICTIVQNENPIPEGQLRPLAVLEPEQQREAWQRANDTAQGKVTAVIVQGIVDEMTGKSTDEKHLVYDRTEHGSGIVKCSRCNQLYDGTKIEFCPYCAYTQEQRIEYLEHQNKVPNHVEITLFSHRSKEYYTPKEYADAARLVMGKIDLDPASCDEAQKNIGAKKYYTEKDDGLAQEWRGKVWLNPPYSKTEGESNQAIWSHRLVTEYKSGNVTQAILLVKAALGYKWFEELWDIAPAVCFARNRLSFILEDGTDEGQSKQGTAFFYFGDDTKKFIEVFTRFGRVMARGRVYQCRES